jgi:type I restriction-modification system DNA methylase subunit
VFRSVDQGSDALGIPAYNGGLFAESPELDELEISDEMCLAFKDLGDYDFGDDVSVDVLGHIFEQSITDLEQLRHEAREQSDVGLSPAATVAQSKGTQKTPTKRKSEGIFYTPPFVTSFLVRETLGLAIGDAWQRANDGRGATKKDRIATWEAYQGELRNIRVLDPACGSGAFLIAAFDVLAHEFERANRTLAELRGKQTSLFDLTRTVLNENLFGVDKSGESVEIARLSLWLKTAERGKKLTFLDRNVRQGNSVVEDPMVDPWAFDWQQGRVAQSFLEPEPRSGEEIKTAEAIDARWRGGFDVVIGNPPYVRQELLSAYKEHWRNVFSTYDGTADLFVYFFERGLKALKQGGRLGFIVSNKWLRGGYAEKLRAHFGQNCTIDTLVDFGHAPIFPDADAFPCIITLRKASPPPDHAVRVTRYPREQLGKESVAAYVEQHAFSIPQKSLTPAGWTLEPPGVQALLDKLRGNGIPLGEYTNTKPYRGVLTGCNEAFLIDNTSKERLCREDPRSAEVMKKYLRGRDVERWSPQWAGYWLLLIQSSENHAWPWSNLRDEGDAEAAFRQTFPAIHAHLKPLETRLRKRTDKGRFWWELRSCSYYDLFERKRILYPDIIWRGSFCIGESGLYSNNTVYFLPSEDSWTVACLNSPAMWSYLWRNAQHAKDEALRMFSEFVVTIPIANASTEIKETVSASMDHVISSTRGLQQMAAGVLDLLRMQFDVDSPGNALSDFGTLDSDAFVREVKKRRPKGSTLSPAGLRALRELHAAQTPPIYQARAAIIGHERRIADAVHAAYGLTPEDLALLRATAPPRMPPGW